MDHRLLGRDADLAAIAALSRAAREQQGGALVIRGEGGVGKTALLREAERTAAAVEPWGRGRAYLNFAERPTASVTGFDEDAHARLLAIRARYDGRALMRANHPIAG